MLSRLRLLRLALDLGRLPPQVARRRRSGGTWVVPRPGIGLSLALRVFIYFAYQHHCSASASRRCDGADVPIPDVRFNDGRWRSRQYLDGILVEKSLIVTHFVLGDLLVLPSLGERTGCCSGDPRVVVLRGAMIGVGLY